MAYFHLKRIPPRKIFPFDGTEVEKAAMARHVDDWREQAAARTAALVGPVFDPAGAYGMAIVDAGEEAAPHRLGNDDPIIHAGLGFRYGTAPMPSIILRD